MKVCQDIVPHKIGSYVIKETIGEGSFSIVKLAYCKENNMFYACKIIPKSRLASNNLYHRFETEIRINQQLNHPGVVALVDMLKDENNYYIIMEFCPNGELFKYIVDHGKLSESEARPMFRQILEALLYIHNMSVVHRDLKPENILIDQYGMLKISDFGLGRFFDSDGNVTTPCGSPCYASPECISGKPYSAKTTDVWSCGVILYAMLTGELPWTKRNRSELFNQIRNCIFDIPPYLSEECSNFLRGLMTADTTKRLTIQQALDHTFMTNSNETCYQMKNSNYIRVSLRRVDDFFGTNIDYNKVKDPVLRRSYSSGQNDIEKILKEINDLSPNMMMKQRLIKESKPRSATGKICRKIITTNFSIARKIPADPIRKKTDMKIVPAPKPKVTKLMAIPIKPSTDDPKTGIIIQRLTRQKTHR